MSFTSQVESGSYKEDLRALIGATNFDTSRIGYCARNAVSGWSYHYSVAGSSVISNITATNHSTLVLQGNGESPTNIQPYVTIYFWKRIA